MTAAPSTNLPSRFVLFSMPRTGSTMVATGLSSLDDVICLPALFSKSGWPGDPGDLLYDLRTKLGPAWDDPAIRNKRPYALVRELAGLLGARARLLGWKHHLVQDAAVTQVFFKNAAIKKIILKRENLLASYSSEMIVRVTGQGRVDRGTTVVRAKCFFSADDFKTYCFRRQKVHARWAEIANEAPATLQVEYADVISEGFGQILKFLGLHEGLQIAPLSVKRNSNDILSRFENPEVAFAYLRDNGREEWAVEGMVAKDSVDRRTRASEHGDKLDFAVSTELLPPRRLNRARVPLHRGDESDQDNSSKFSLDFLQSQGLKPNHSLLEMGCGDLSAGRAMIEYLNVGRYTGFDHSKAAIASGNRIVHDGLADCKPRLFVSDGRLTFEALSGRKFGFLVAQFSLSRLSSDLMHECVSHLRAVMHAGSRFFFSIADTDSRRCRSNNMRRADHEVLAIMEEKHGLLLRACPGDHRPGRCQRFVARLRKS